MKLLKIDTKKNIIRGLINSYDDLVVLQYIIERGDRLVSYSKRKVAIGDEQVIKVVKIGIEVETIGLESGSLRVGGKIFYTSDEDIPLHKYHTLDLRVKTAFTVRKDKILGFQVRLIKNAQERSPKVFVCVYEPGYAIMYSISNYSLRRMYEVKHNVQGKRFKNDSRLVFLDKLGKALVEEYSRRKWNVFIVAGTAIDNEDLRRGVLKDLDIVYETVSYADTGLKELVGKDRINELISRTKIATQRNLIGEYVGGISKGDEKYVYGKDAVRAATGETAVVQAIVTKEYVLFNKDAINQLDAGNVDIVFFDEKDDSLDQLQGLGGIILKLS